VLYVLLPFCGLNLLLCAFVACRRKDLLCQVSVLRPVVVNRNISHGRHALIVHILKEKMYKAAVFVESHTLNDVVVST
jgi:hypothetical protein